MKTLIISDIHGSIEGLKAALNTPYDYDRIFFLGDFLYHGPRNPILSDYNPQKVADCLNELKKPLLAVRGNCDAEVDQMLLNFPITQDATLTTQNTKQVFITHGHIIDPKDAHTTHADIFLSGHTHLPGFNLNENTLCVNPGSISLPKDDHPKTYALMDDKGITIYTIEHEVYLEYIF